VGAATLFGCEVEIARGIFDGLLDVDSPILCRFQVPSLLIGSNQKRAKRMAVGALHLSGLVRTQSRGASSGRAMRLRKWSRAASRRRLIAGHAMISARLANAIARINLPSSPDCRIDHRLPTPPIGSFLGICNEPLGLDRKERKGEPARVFDIDCRHEDFPHSAGAKVAGTFNGAKALKQRCANQRHGRQSE
jgi:hypothetical protein